MGWLDDILAEKSKVERERAAGTDNYRHRYSSLQHTYDRQVRGLLADLAKACFGREEWCIETPDFVAAGFPPYPGWELVRVRDRYKALEIIMNPDLSDGFFVTGVFFHNGSCAFSDHTRGSSDEELKQTLRKFLQTYFRYGHP